MNPITIIGKILGLPGTIDSWRDRWYRRRPVIETEYLRQEGVEEKTGDIVGALKVTIQNRSDRKFTIKRGSVDKVNGNHIMVRGSLGEFEVEPHDYETSRLEFRYNEEELFEEGENTGVLQYYFKDEKGGEIRKAKLKDLS